MGTIRELSDLVGSDTLDSRELYDRLNELEDALALSLDGGPEFPDEDREELEALKALQDETEGYAGDNWRDGVTFIADKYFEQYAEEYADDIGAIDKDATWPLSHIDWTAAADDLKQDYTEVEIHGISYWYR